jgi:arylsulfatase A-like enzyme
MKKIMYCLLGISFMTLGCIINPKKNNPSSDKRPNILLIAVDDLNDWIGPLKGHPQALTPNMDRLANEGILFTNAHCQAPVCTPSRSSLMTSLYPSTTGLYFLNPDIKHSPIAKKNVLMPQRFQNEGYYVTGVGKLFHNGRGINEKYVPNYGGNYGGFGPFPKEKITDFPGHSLWDWGIFPNNDTLMPDYKLATWAESILKNEMATPFWMGVGFYRPHVPQYAPKKWFDLYPLDSIQLPKIITNDLDDLSKYGRDITREGHVSPKHEWVVQNEQWKPLVQSYLACVSFVDAQIGRVFDAIKNSDYAKNTYVVLFSDHGFHLGEKERYAKRSLWNDGTRVPLIFWGPNISKGNCTKPVQLLDIYPTLLELTHISPDKLHEGHSLINILRGKEVKWPHHARTTFGPGNHAIISENYRYVRYNDQTEEFYDHTDDPHEWENKSKDPKYQELIEQHRALLPEDEYVALGKGSTGHISYQISESSKN